MITKIHAPNSHTKSTLVALLALALFAGPLPTLLRADLSDYTKINASEIEDVTLSASYQILYFRAKGKNYSYAHPAAANQIRLAEIVELLGEAQTLLLKEANPRGSVDLYYDGQRAIQIRSILLKFGKAKNLND